MLWPNQRPDVRRRVAAGPHAQLLRFLGASTQKSFVQTAMHIAPLYRQASLPGIYERSPNRRARRDVNIRIVEHQHGILPTQLQNDRQQPRRGSRCNTLPGRHAPGENQLVNRSLSEGRTGSCVADDHLKHILRHARCMQQRT